MFDVSFSELVVIGIVALVVIGPERLPKVARTAGILLGRLQRYVQDVKADISREMQLDELKKLQADVQESARRFEQDLAGEMQKIHHEVGEAVGTLPDAAPKTEEPSLPLPRKPEATEANIHEAGGSGACGHSTNTGA